VRLGAKILLVLTRLYARVVGLDEIEASVALPLAFLEYYAEAKKAEKRKRGAVALGAALSLLLVLVALALLLWLTRWNLSALSNVPPLSWQAVGPVWAYAWGFTAVVVILLAALALILALAELAWRRRLPDA